MSSSTPRRSRETDQDRFEITKEQYDQLLAALEATHEDLKELKKENESLKEVQEKAANKEARNQAFDEIKELQKRLRRTKGVNPFEYSHQGSLAYIGSEKAVADISWFSGNIASGGTITYFFWRSAYLSMCFSTRNRILVLMDWVKAKVFGRDVSRV